MTLLIEGRYRLDHVCPIPGALSIGTNEQGHQIVAEVVSVQSWVRPFVHVCQALPKAFGDYILSKVLPYGLKFHFRHARL